MVNGVLIAVEDITMPSFIHRSNPGRMVVTDTLLTLEDQELDLESSGSSKNS